MGCSLDTVQRREERRRRQTAFFTIPERKQRVQTRIRRLAPLTTARTVCRFGLNVRRVLLFAWLTLLPD